MTDRPDLRNTNQRRRVVRVTSFDDDGYAEGKSWWQALGRDGWADMDYPPPRKTRIRAAAFKSRFVRLEEQ